MKTRLRRADRPKAPPRRKTTTERRRTPGGAAYFFDVATGGVFGLNAAAEVMADALEIATSKDDLVAALVAAFDVDALEAARDVDAFLATLLEHGLVEN